MMVAFSSANPQASSVKTIATIEGDSVEELDAVSHANAAPGMNTVRQRNYVLNDVGALKKKLQHEIEGMTFFGCTAFIYTSLAETAAANTAIILLICHAFIVH